MNRPDIDADLKVARLLEYYPELETPLVEMAPEFKKLRNPVLRRTIARITSLGQAASIGGLPVQDLVNRLRIIAGMPPLEVAASQEDELMGPEPRWVRDNSPVQTFDASEFIRTGQMPLNRIMNHLEQLKPGQVYLLITPLLPAPLLDKTRQKGFLTWTMKDDAGNFKSFIVRS